jgi:hypothetical protein
MAAEAESRISDLKSEISNLNPGVCARRLGTLPAAILVALASLPAMAQDAEPATSPRPSVPEPRQSAQNNAMEGEITPELDAAIAKGLRYLVTQQGEDGAFGDGRFGKNVAVSALAGIALMGDGNLPGRGPYGEAVAKCTQYILANCTESGLVAGDAANGPMYGHGFATLYLGEVYGMTAGGGDTALSARLHEALVKAVRLIEQTQNEQGGWRYNPVPYDADVSVTIAQIMALRSARNAGIEVSKDTIDRAVEYVRRCQNPDGGFRYQLDMGASGWPRSAAGVASLYYAGIYEDDAIDKGIAYLIREAMPGQPTASKAHYFYGQYYAVQAMYLAGGENWAKWWPAIREELTRAQQTNGSWEDRSVGDSYGTAMALIILQMPKRYLPIFQK